MPIPEEIKSIARGYAETVYAYYEPDYSCDWERAVDGLTNDLIAFVQLLSKDYCIVPKSKVKELYAKTESDHCHVDEDNDWVVNIMLGRMEYIFGKELFNKEKE